MVNKRVVVKWLLIVHFACLFVALPTLGQSITGKVVGVSDGDTITVLDAGRKQHKIRLYGIDTPEKGQAYGNVAKNHTSSLTAGKTVDVISYDTDRYGRTVGVVMIGKVNVNQSLIETGYAWQYSVYCKQSFCDSWKDLEQKARSAKLGLWADPEPIAPWEWRREKRNGNASVGSVNASVHLGVYHGNVKSHVFHAPDCQHYNCKNCIVTFNSFEDAVAAGYRKHKQCVRE